MADQEARPPIAGREAGLVSRALALGIDVALIGMLSMGLRWLTALMVETLLLSTPRFLEALGAAYARAGVAGVALLYMVGFWVLAGATPGKWLLGLRVVRADGGRLGVLQALVRFVGYTLSATPLLLGFAWVLFDRRRQAWHDKLARTVVIYSQPGRQRVTRVSLARAGSHP